MSNEIAPSLPKSDYMDLVNAALREAENQIKLERYKSLKLSHSSREAAIQFRKEQQNPLACEFQQVQARLRAAINTARLFQNLTQAMLHILWMIHEHRDWQVAGYGSLFDWAKSNIIDSLSGHYSDPEDYVNRLCNSVVGFLADVNGQNVRNPASGDLIKPSDIIENTTISNIKEANFPYQKADDTQKQQLILVLATGASNSTFDQIRETILHPEGRKKPDPIYIGLRTNANGTNTIIADLSDDELAYLRARLAGERISWTLPEELGYQALEHYELEAEAGD